MEKILILDNYDSFTYNIVHLLHELGTEVDIARNDRISVEEAGRYNRIILSPGPGIPSEAGILPEVVKRYAAEKDLIPLLCQLMIKIVGKNGIGRASAVVGESAGSFSRYLYTGAGDCRRKDVLRSG